MADRWALRAGEVPELEGPGAEDGFSSEALVLKP